MCIRDREKISPYSIFRDESVLKKVLSADTNGEVSMGVDVANALVSAIASVATKHSAANRIGAPYKSGTASSANNIDSFPDAQDNLLDDDNNLICLLYTSRCV